MLKVSVRSMDRLSIELAYVQEKLGTGGVRVLDTGSPGGARAIALARAGFAVTAWEPAARAAAEARRRSETEAAGIEWAVVDPHQPWAWPTPNVAAVICSEWLVRDDRVRVLRRLRQQLPPGVRLIGVAPCARHSDVEREEMVAALGRAGFLIEDCRTQATDEEEKDESWILITATAIAAPPRSLAVTAWGSEAGEPMRLDLRYAPDEAPLLDPAPADIWRDAEDLDHSLERISHYPVDDPFGARRGTPVIARFFDCNLDETQVTFAAGVTSLLHALASLADDGAIASDPLVHGDLESWALSRGGNVVVLPSALVPGDLPDVLGADPPALLHLDRPTFAGQVADLETIRRAANVVARRDGAVVIDESAMPYLGPSASTVRLVNDVPNLIVLRGFTKAYSWGGLRAGFAVTSKPMAVRVREVVPPLQVAENTLYVVLRMLSAGDVFARIRDRIREVKPAATDALARAGFRAHAGHSDLPWVALDDPGGDSTRRLLARGMRPLAPTPHPAVRNPPEVIRVTVPLSDARMKLFHDLLQS